jgi:hypothetical protein
MHLSDEQSIYFSKNAIIKQIQIILNEIATVMGYTHWLVGWLVGWSIGWLVGQSSGWLVNPLAC